VDMFLHRHEHNHAECPMQANHSKQRLTTPQLCTRRATRSRSASDAQLTVAVSKVKSAPTWPWAEDHMTLELVERMNCDEILQNDTSYSKVDTVDALISHPSRQGELEEINSLFCCASLTEFATTPDDQNSSVLPGWVSPPDESTPERALTSVDSVRKASEQHILQSTSCRQNDDAVDGTQNKLEPASRTLWWYWVMCGILAHSGSKHSSRYRNLIGLILVCCTGLCMCNLLFEPSRTVENLAEIAISASCLVSLVCSRGLDSLIGHKDHLLAWYAKHHNFLKIWNRRGMVSLAVFQMVWVCKAAAYVTYSHASGSPNSLRKICTDFAVLFQAGSHLGMMHCAFHVTSFLQLMLDGWTVDFNKRRDCIQGADAWNSVQALMRRVADAIQTCFLALQTSALITLICCAARIVDIIVNKAGDDMRAFGILVLLDIPSIIMAVCALAWFAKASAVTEQSVRIPPVVNSLLLRPQTQIACEDQMFVNFIKNSDAGFYVSGSRLTATVFMNYCYLCGAVICALFSAALNMYQQQ